MSNQKEMNSTLMINKHLIKRSSKFSDTSPSFNLNEGGWLCEVKIGSRPSGYKVKKRDIIYVAESGYAIYGKGEVGEIVRKENLGLDEFVQFACCESNIKDSRYWFPRIQKFVIKRKENQKIFILEYKLINTVSYETPFLLQEKYNQQSSWYYLDENFVIEDVPEFQNVVSKIPGHVRMEIYSKYNLHSKSHIIDIDHFVPKSVGGPGSIGENLVPIGLSLNRVKSNRVPSKLFYYADLVSEDLKLRCSKIKIEQEIFYKDPQLIGIAKLITKKINSMDINEIKKIYEDIKRFHNRHHEK